MLVTLVAILCNSQQLCLEKIVTTSDQSGITMTACAVTRADRASPTGSLTARTMSGSCRAIGA